MGILPVQVPTTAMQTSFPKLQVVFLAMAVPAQLLPTTGIPLLMWFSIRFMRVPGMACPVHPSVVMAVECPSGMRTHSWIVVTAIPSHVALRMI
jgi:hypothetical protein